MFFRKTGVKCKKCRLFEPSKENASKGRCHIVDIDDADSPRDCRWYEEKEDAPKSSEGGASGKNHQSRQ